MSENNELNLPWSFKHTEQLADYGMIVDSTGKDIATVYGIFGGNRAHLIEHILKTVNPPEVVVKEEAPQ